MIIISAVALAGALLLVWTGVEHLRTAAGAASRAGGLLHALLGVLSVVVLVQRVGTGPWVLAAQAALHAAFAGVLAVRLARSDRGDCRCTQITARVGPTGVGRAGVLAVASAVAAVGYPAVVLPGLDLSDPRVALVIAAAVTGGTLCYALPAALDGAPVAPSAGRGR